MRKRNVWRDLMEIRGVYYELSGKPGVHRQITREIPSVLGLEHMRELMKRLEIHRMI